ncbi:MAG: hypothetical protein WBC44_14345 [Planctomycetaceae bacterium]
MTTACELLSTTTDTGIFDVPHVWAEVGEGGELLPPTEPQNLRAAAERLMPRNEFLIQLAAHSPPPAEWYDEDSPF